jgi:uncharacterized membrane protein
MKPMRFLRARPRLIGAFAAGALLSFAWPGEMLPMSRVILGWNMAVWSYLLMALHMMLKADRAHLQRHAIARADGLGSVLLLSAVGALASLVAIALEQSQIKHGADVAVTWPHLVLALTTVAGAWLFLPVEFALAYASLYHRDGHCHGLDFPGDEVEATGPDYLDFLYFSVTIAACSQTSDVAVNSRPMRRLVLLHTVLAFAFNTGVLALTINILAGLVG